MFNNSNSQFISVIKYHNQLKLDYKLLNQDEITSSNQSSFLLHKEYMPQDVVFKLNHWQKESNNTYIATVCGNQDQIIIPKTDTSKNDDYSIVELNTSLNVGIKNSILFEHVHYFDKTGVDFIYSPYHIINLHVEQNPSGNNLVMLIIDDHLYLSILNENSEIVYNCIKTLTSFDDIKQTEFYDSEVVGQKLFDEVYYYEIQNLIQGVISEFYETKNNVFIEKIVILYTLKQLNDAQISAMKNDILIDIKYHPISIDSSLFELSKESANSFKSFIKPRKKTKKSNTSLWIIATVITTLIAAGVFYYLKIQNSSETVKIQKETKQIFTKVEPKKKEIIKETKVKVIEETVKIVQLPNHIVKNRDILKRLLLLFDVIPYDVLLKEITLKNDESIIDVTLLKDDIYIKSMQSPLSKLYKYSEIKFDDIESTILNATVYNSGRIIEKDLPKVLLPKYIKDEFLPQERVYEQLKAIFPQNGIIKFDSNFKSDVLTYNYTVNIIVDTPLEFFEIIEDINKELYSMNIGYPILLRKTIDGIEIEFNFQFHQYL